MDKFILCCFLWICPVFGSNVYILVPDSLANGKACECGRDLTLSCKFKNKTFALAWMNLHDISPIAQCVGNKCDINPKYIDQYKISYDETNHIFNLTIIKLTMKDNGRQLVCSDGTSTDSQIITVKDYEPLILENTTTGTIQAISGCVTNVTKVSFKWIKIYASSKRETEITPKIKNASITSCSKDSDCGIDQQIQYSEVISAKASNNGNYFLKIVAEYGNKQKESYYTVGRYLIEDRGSVGRYLIENRDEDRSNTVIVVAVVLVVFVLILATALLYLYRKGRLINIWRKFITCCKGNSDGRRFSQTKNETDKQSQRDYCQKKEDTKSYNDLREKGVIQRLGGYDGTEDLTISAPDLNLDLPKHNVEEVSSEANEMPVNELSVNDLSLNQAVTEIEEETNLFSKEQAIIDLTPDVVQYDEKEKDLLAKHHNSNSYMLENENKEYHFKKYEIIGIVNPTCAQNDDMLENDMLNKLSVNESSVNDHCLGHGVPVTEAEKDLSFEKQTLIGIHPDGDELGNDEKQKYLPAKRYVLDGDMLENEEEKNLLSKEQTKIDPNTDSDENEENFNAECGEDE